MTRQSEIKRVVSPNDLVDFRKRGDEIELVGIFKRGGWGVWSWRSGTQDRGDVLLWCQSFRQPEYKARGGGGLGQPCGLGWPGSLVPGRLASQWVCVALAVWRAGKNLPSAVGTVLCPSSLQPGSPSGVGVVIFRGVLWEDSLDIPRKKHVSRDVIFAVVYSGEVVTVVVVPCLCPPLSLSLFLSASVSVSLTWTPCTMVFSSQHNWKHTFSATETENLWKHIGLINEGKLLVTLTFIANRTHAPFSGSVES